MRLTQRGSFFRGQDHPLCRRRSDFALRWGWLLPLSWALAAVLCACLWAMAETRYVRAGWFVLVLVCGVVALATRDN